MNERGRPPDVVGSGAGEQVVSLRPVMVVCLLVLAVWGVSQLATDADELRDTDGYMRAVRVHELLDGSSPWWDGSATRSNAPFGHSMHWTRPMDVVLAVPALALAPVLGLSGGVYWSSVLAGPLLQLALAFVAAWAAIPLLGRSLAPVVGLVAAVQPVVAAYTAPGRADHHGLILLVTIWTFGALIRSMPDGDPAPRWATTTGLSAALGLWVSTEYLAVVAVVGVGGALGWVWYRGRASSQARVWTAMTLATAAAILIERGPRPLEVSYDRVSVVHLFVVGVIAAGWAVLGVMESRIGPTPAPRLLSGLVVVAAVAAAIASAFPDFYGGPFVEVPAEARAIWLEHVSELGPLFGQVGSASAMLGLVGMLIVPSFGIWSCARRMRAGRRTAGWSIVLVGVGVFLLLSVFQIRWVAHAEMIGALPFTALFARPMDRAASIRPPLRAAAMVVVVAVAAFGWQIAPVAAAAVASEDQGAEACSARELADYLRRAGGASEIVLAAVDVGPELLYRSDARVVASPYHRNVAGILDSFRALGSDDWNTLADTVSTRGIDWVAVCPGYDAGYFGDARVYERLAAGEHPPFLGEPAPPDETGGFLVYRVR